MACITNKKKSKRGRWCIDFYDQSGKRRLKVLPKGATKTEAKKALREIEDQVEKRVWMPIKNIPKFSEVADNWLENKRQNVRASTWVMYASHLKYHFNDLNHMKINRITTAKVERYITDRQKEKMNITTLRKTIVTLNQIMNYSVRHRYIDHNPVRDAERPKGQGGEENIKIQVLVPSQITKFLESTSNQKYQTLFMLAVFSGVRQGELFGLKWTDVDWFNSQIHIKRTYNNGAWYKPKSQSSIRKIDIGPATMDKLKTWRKVCPKSELVLIFPNENGGPLDHWHLSDRYFFPALKNAGLPKIRFHDLRHTYASLLIEQGENIKYIQDQLGHASATFTLNVYGHLMKPTNQEAACRLENQVFETNGDQMETTAKKEVVV